MIEQDKSFYGFSRMAVDKAKLCPVSATKNPMPKVAIVIAIEDRLLGWCAKGVGGEFLTVDGFKAFSVEANTHAEQALLEKLQEVDLSNATAYVTLEPCTKRKGKGTCCAKLLVNSGIKSVYVGNIDPNPDVSALAWRVFFQSGISVYDFAPELRNEAMRDNASFFGKFRVSTHDEGGASFDYENNGGERILGVAGMEFRTRWTNRGNGSIYALDNVFNVALAKNCTVFDQVDDPGRWFEDSHYTKPVSEGEIVVFRNKAGFALVKVTSVRVRTNTTNAELNFQYQLRYSKNALE